MKLFRGGGSGKSKQPQQPEPVQQQEELSIGSELSSRDQFDIIVRQQQNAVTANRTLSRKHQNHKSRGGGGLLSYFSGDDDDNSNSTVSSITLDGQKRFGLFQNPKNRGYSGGSAGSSWCCCSDNTAPTEHTADTNTLMHSARSTRSVHGSLMGDPYTQARYRAIQQQQQQLQQSKQGWLSNASCAPTCGAAPVPLKATKPKRPRLFRRTNTSTAVRSSTRSLMSNSLFDALSEDWDDEDGGKRVGSVRRKSQQFRRSLTWKRGKQQAM